MSQLVERASAIAIAPRPGWSPLKIVHFNPDLERDYLQTERDALARTIRGVALAAAIVLCAIDGFAAIRFGFLANRLLVACDSLTLCFALGLLIFTKSEIYKRHPACDVAVFVTMTALLLLLFWVFTSSHFGVAVLQSASENVGQLNMAVFYASVAVLYASMAFGGAPNVFAAWCIVLSAAVFVLLLTLTNFSEAVLFEGNFLFIAAYAAYANVTRDRKSREAYLANHELAKERKRSEELLYNVLPKEVAERIKDGEVIADGFTDLTVVFADIVGFSQLARRLSPGHLVDVLNTFFQAADACSVRNSVEKVKTIGDAYLAVAGGMGSLQSGTTEAIKFARELVDELRKVQEQLQIPMQIRVGIHTGPAVGGVVGSARYAYDYWGDTVNIASRIETVAPPGRIAVSEPVFYRARTFCQFGAEQRVLLKGIGEVTIFLLEDEERRAAS